MVLLIVPGETRYLNGSMHVRPLSFVCLACCLILAVLPLVYNTLFGLCCFVFSHVACIQAMGCVLYAVCYLKNPFQDAGNLGILNAR